MAVLSENSGFASSDTALVSYDLALRVVVPADFSVEPRALCQTSSCGLSTGEKG